MLTDIEIAREANTKPITDIASSLNIDNSKLYNYGQDIAKVDLPYLNDLPEKESKLILVTAISPTPAGEGKTTTTVGLGDGLNLIGKKAMMCLREPSLGPCFGVKGGAAGGGMAQVVPMEDINLHFTGDFHAITSAHNLLSALIDNHIYWGNKLNIDSRKVVWRQVLDMNDRSLRSIVQSLGDKNGFAREDGFDITVASEIMAIFCLAKDLDDLNERIANITIGYTREGEAIKAGDLNANGAMTTLLKNAIAPNLVQTLENNPAFIHGGPFANIAHGCNSVVATRSAMKLADYVVTEAGFGADLGAEKFLDIKCRKAGITPNAVVLVATIRALKMHGGVPKTELGASNVDALSKGVVNLERHVNNIRGFGLPVMVAINHFSLDSDEEINFLVDYCKSDLNVPVSICKHWAEGSVGVEDLAHQVVGLCEQENNFDYVYSDDLSLFEKIESIAQKIYKADGVTMPETVRKQLASFEEQGYGHFPVCIAKTQYSFSTDMNRMGAPTGHELQVREVRLASGAGFIVVVCGEIMTMPGLPRVPAAEKIYVNDKGLIEGLF